MFAELMGKVEGTNRGRAGSMHIADPRIGVFGANGIVAAGLPIAVGAAAAGAIRKSSAVTVAFFGDGAVAQGAFHEAVNLAALWHLPVAFFCENNGFAEFSLTSEQQPVDLRTRAGGYGIEFHQVDGNDVVAVAEVMTAVVDQQRRGGGPVMIEAVTYRWRGHYEGDPERYRSAEERQDWMTHRDPLGLLDARLTGPLGQPEGLLATVRADVDAQVTAAIEFARAAPNPQPEEVLAYVYHEPDRRLAPAPASPPTPGDQEFRGMDAIRAALQRALDDEEAVFLAGVDVGKGGNVFGLTRGLNDTWPRRVLDTPISETAVVGLAVGAAMAGLHPVVEIMYFDFIGVCFDQILNQAAKLHFMTAGRATLGLTIRTQFGVGRSSGSQHSQSLEALLAHVPGLKVVMPSNPADTYGLLRASILDPNPVVFVENRLLYGQRGPRPPEDFLVPLGVARVARVGQQATIVCWSKMVNEALAAADEAAAEGIDVEVIDLRTVCPIDFDAIEQSVTKTGRLLVAHEAVTRHGLGAEIAARIGEDLFGRLDAPVLRLGGKFAPVPYSPTLEAAWLPGRQRILEAVRTLVNY
jgi:2-oxoisovalerate dehydrogenase E1 component